MDILDMVNFGCKFKAMGNDWIQLQLLGDGQYCLAVLETEIMPAHVYVVQKYTDEVWKERVSKK